MTRLTEEMTAMRIARTRCQTTNNNDNNNNNNHNNK